MSAEITIDFFFSGNPPPLSWWSRLFSDYKTEREEKKLFVEFPLCVAVIESESEKVAVSLRDKDNAELPVTLTYGYEMLHDLKKYVVDRILNAVRRAAGQRYGGATVTVEVWGYNVVEEEARAVARLIESYTGGVVRCSVVKRKRSVGEIAGVLLEVPGEHEEYMNLVFDEAYNLLRGEKSSSLFLWR